MSIEANENISSPFQNQLRDALRDNTNIRARNYLRFPDALERAIEFGESYLGSYHPEGLSGGHNRTLIDQVNKWVRENVEGERLNAVYMDSTTLFTVQELLSDRVLAHPEFLFDLSNFVNAVVLFDRVFYLKNPYADILEFNLNEAMGAEPIVKAIPVEEFFKGSWEGVSAVGTILTGIWKDTRDHFDKLAIAPINDPLHSLAAEIQDAWEMLLGISLPDKTLLFREWRGKWNSPVRDLLTDALEVLSANPRTYGYESQRHSETAYELANECNQRSLFNLKVAQLLRLPYLPGWARMPIRHSLYRRGREAQQVLASAEFLDDRYRAKAAEFLECHMTLQLPFFLSAALSKTTSLKQFWSVLADMRRTANKFRAHRTEYDHALADGNLKVVKRIQKALEQEADKIRLKLGDFCKAAVIGGALTWGAISLGIGEAESVSLAILLTGAIHGGTHHLGEHMMDRIKERLTRPDYWCLTSFAEAAYELTNSWGRIGKLWQLPDKQSDEFGSRLSRLRDLQYG